MKTDIETRGDIEKFIIAFYDKVKQDETIGFIFNDVVKMDWAHHIPIIVDFWESILLDNPLYKRNAMEVHYTLNQKLPLQKEHFDRWLQLFSAAIDELHEGSIASSAKTRAKGIADIMLLKMNSINNKNSII
jgi:hemoglobin